MSRRKLSWLAVAVVALFFLYYLYGGSTVPAGQPALVRLKNSNLAALKDAFNASAGSVRVLLLVSPT
jgi:hypothetical protein